jgi:SpoVK/Ycf46/Vps4 family AAA+-type ATPase
MSNESKHTPGPLEYIERDINEDCRAGHIIKRRPATEACRADPLVAMCYEMGGDIAGAEEMIANGKLFAAAPDMLKALTKAERWITDLLNELRDDHPRLCVYNEVFGASIRNEIINAIAKARGEA